MTRAATISNRISKTAVFRPRGEFKIYLLRTLRPIASGQRPAHYTPRPRTSVLESRKRAGRIAQTGPQPERQQTPDRQKSQQPKADRQPIQSLGGGQRQPRGRRLRIRGRRGREGGRERRPL